MRFLKFNNNVNANRGCDAAFWRLDLRRCSAQTLAADYLSRCEQNVVPAGGSVLDLQTSTEGRPSIGRPDREITRKRPAAWVWFQRRSPAAIAADWDTSASRATCCSGSLSNLICRGGVRGRKESLGIPSQPRPPSTVHDDLLVVYAEQEHTRAVYFDNEGHVIHSTPSFFTYETK